MKNHQNLYYLHKIIVFSLFINPIFAQKKDNPNTIITPTSQASKIEPSYFMRAKQQFEREAQDYRIDDETNQGIQVMKDSVSFLTRTKRVGLHFISKDKILDLLYNTTLDKESENFGFWIFFSRKNTELAFVRKGEVAAQKYFLLRPTPKTPPSSLVKKPSLSSLRQGFPYKIKGYFIGRRLLTKQLIDGDFNFYPNISGINIDVREDSSHKYSIVFSVVYQNKTSNYVGFASFNEYFDLIPDPTRRVPIGGGASSRPCPTHCPEE